MKNAERKEIANELVGQFRNKSVGTVGKILFTKFSQVAVNEKFDAFRLKARITTFSGAN